MLRRLLPLTALVLLALPSTASAADLTYGAVPTDGALVGGVVSWTVTGTTDGSPINHVWVAHETGHSPFFPFAGTGVISFDTRQVPDGRHRFSVEWQGGGQPQFDRSWWLDVDNTAPGAPVPTGPTQITTDRPGIALSFTRPTGETANVVEGTVCDRLGCRSLGPQTLFRGDAVGVTPLEFGVSTVTVWLRDRAGNADPARSASWTITRTLPPSVPVRLAPPGLTIASAKVRADRRTLTVAGKVAMTTDEKVSVTARVTIRGRQRTVRRVARVVRGDYRAHLTVPSGRWTSARITATTAANTMIAAGEVTRTVRQIRRVAR